MASHTNTWNNRHKAQLDYLLQVARLKLDVSPEPLSDGLLYIKDDGKYRPLRILDIGPGGVPGNDKSGDIKKHNLLPKVVSSIEKLAPPLARVKTSAARKYSNLDFITHEPTNLIDTFGEFSIDLAIAEIDPKVIQAAESCVDRKRPNLHSYKVVRHNIQLKANLVQTIVDATLLGKGPVYFDAKSRQGYDIIWAGVLFCYLKDKSTALNNIWDSLAPLGLFSMTEAHNFSVVKRLFRAATLRTDEDYFQAAKLKLGKRAAEYIPSLSYADHADLILRHKSETIVGEYPVWRKPERVLEYAPQKRVFTPPNKFL